MACTMTRSKAADDHSPPRTLFRPLAVGLGLYWKPPLLLTVTSPLPGLVTIRILAASMPQGISSFFSSPGPSTTRLPLAGWGKVSSTARGPAAGRHGRGTKRFALKNIHPYSLFVAAGQQAAARRSSRDGLPLSRSGTVAAGGCSEHKRVLGVAHVLLVRARTFRPQVHSGIGLL